MTYKYEILAQSEESEAERSLAEFAREVAALEFGIDEPPLSFIKPAGSGEIAFDCDIDGLAQRSPEEIFIRAGLEPLRTVTVVVHEVRHIFDFKRNLSSELLERSAKLAELEFWGEMTLSKSSCELLLDLAQLGFPIAGRRGRLDLAEHYVRLLRGRRDSWFDFDLALWKIEKCKRAVRARQIGGIEHANKIEQLTAEFLRRRDLPQEGRVGELAEAFFATGAHAPVDDIKKELTQLQEQTPLFDAEIQRRQGVVEQLRGRYSAHLWDSQMRARDLKIKHRMARALMELSGAGAEEMQLVNEIVAVDASPPGEFRVMRPTFVGVMSDQNSFINSWLRELRAYYPNVTVNDD